MLSGRIQVKVFVCICNVYDDFLQPSITIGFFIIEVFVLAIISIAILYLVL